MNIEETIQNRHIVNIEFTWQFIGDQSERGFMRLDLRSCLLYMYDADARPISDS